MGRVWCHLLMLCFKMKVDVGHSCQCVGAGRDSSRPTVGGNAKPSGLSEAGTLDGNETGHLSEDCDSQMLCNG